MLVCGLWSMWGGVAMRQVERIVSQKEAFDSR